MPRRPREHQLEDIAAAKLADFFGQAGWTIQPLKNDYGEDFLVRIFENEKPTPLAFYVQSKATDTFKKAQCRNGNARVRVSVEHARHWLNIIEPVMLTLFDAGDTSIRWEFVHDCKQRDRILQTPYNSIGIELPENNFLCTSKCELIAEKVRGRLNEYLALVEGAQHVVHALKSKYGMDMEYDPSSGCLILPDGEFVLSERGGEEIILFGRLQSMMEEIVEITGLGAQETFEKIVRDAVNRRGVP